jgi:hypothetical protein
MKNEVPSHVAKTLTEVDAEIKERQHEIQQLLGIRTGLCELYEIPPELPIGNLKSERAPKPRRAKTAHTPPRGFSRQKIGGSRCRRIFPAHRRDDGDSIRHPQNAGADHGGRVCRGQRPRAGYGGRVSVRLGQEGLVGAQGGWGVRAHQAIPAATDLKS